MLLFEKAPAYFVAGLVDLLATEPASEAAAKVSSPAVLEADEA